MIKTSTRTRMRALAGASALSIAAALAQGGAGAQATDGVVDIDIAAQPLANALMVYGDQTNTTMVVPSVLTEGKIAPTVQGAMTSEDALQMLLDGSGLGYMRTPDGRTTITVAQAEGNENPQPETVLAQAETGTSTGRTREKIIVTGQKREEYIQDVPIAISAFSQEDLTLSQIAGGPDLITQIPNFTFTKTNFTGYSIQIRGIGTQAISATTDPAVAVAFNNTPFIRNRFFEQEFYDMERVEVLRGPQGTLYGRNATAGVVNLISAKPVLGEDEARMSLDLGNFESQRMEAMVNIPLVDDQVALRLAGAWTKRDGYATNELSGNPIDGRDLWSTRASLRFAPTDRLDVNLIWEHFEEDDDRIRSGKQLCNKHVVTELGGETFGLNESFPGPQQFVEFGPSAIFSQGCTRTSLYNTGTGAVDALGFVDNGAFETPYGPSVPYYGPLSFIGLPVPGQFVGVGSGNNQAPDPYASTVQSQDLRVIESLVDPRYQASNDIGELQLRWQVTDGLTLESETGYNAERVWSTQDFNRFNTAPGAWGQEEYDEVWVPNLGARTGVLEDGVFCDPQIGCSDRLVAVDLSTGDSRQFSQEFRLSSQWSGNFNFSLGANFLRYDGEDKYYVFINSLTLRSAVVSGSSGDDKDDPSVAWVPGVSDNRQFLANGLLQNDPGLVQFLYHVYIDPNPIESVNDQGHNYFLSRNPYKLISYATFGEAYWNLTDNLKLTAGLRYSVDQKTAPRHPSQTLAGNSIGHPALEVIEQEWREPTGRLVLDWKPDLGFTDDTLIYGSYARGYKAGGANPPPFVPSVLGDDAPGDANLADFNVGATDLLRPKVFEPEYVDAFEVGSKNTLLDGDVTLNVAAFYYDYEGYQVSEIVDRSAFNRNFDAEVWGAEFEAEWWALENLRLSFKGGYQKTRIADGEQAIDLMDRTAGNEDWVVVRPYPIYPSSCILPVSLYVRDLRTNPGVIDVRHIGNQSGGGTGACELAYKFGLDPLTGAEYVPNPPPSPSYNIGALPTDYPGFNPETAPNNGQGFAKELGGNELPNAPNYTATISGDYILPLGTDWTLTFHGDFHYQSESWWRVFNDHEYNRLNEYYTMNLAAILKSEDGWNIMGYIKNVTDETAITGAFLNSDDTGLTTNVFLTEPRLYGVRVTKDWTGGTFLGSLIDGHHEGPYKFHVTLGAQVQRWDAPNDPVVLSTLDQFSPGLDPSSDQDKDLDWGDGRDIKVSYEPGNGWSFAAGVRFGKTGGDDLWHTRRELGDIGCGAGAVSFCIYDRDVRGGSGVGGPAGIKDGYFFRYNYTNSSVVDREDHTIVDFTVGRDVGVGLLGDGGFSKVTAGVRYAEFKSKTGIDFYGNNNWEFPEENLNKYVGDPFIKAVHDHYQLHVDVDREFNGVGPTLGWEASQRLLGGENAGVLGLDWSLTGGVLFGKRETKIDGEELYYHYESDLRTFTSLGGFWQLPVYTETTPVSFTRSDDVEVPTLGAALGMSYSIDRFRIGAGYRWERYYDAIDGGYAEEQEVDRTIDGPYLNVTLGFGG